MQEGRGAALTAEVSNVRRTVSLHLQYRHSLCIAGGMWIGRRRGEERGFRGCLQDCTASEQTQTKTNVPRFHFAEREMMRGEGVDRLHRAAATAATVQADGEDVGRPMCVADGSDDAAGGARVAGASAQVGDNLQPQQNLIRQHGTKQKPAPNSAYARVTTE